MGQRFKKTTIGFKYYFNYYHQDNNIQDQHDIKPIHYETIL